jgi:hypothetical protein
MPISKRALLILAGIHVLAGFLFLSPSYIRPDSVAVHAWLRSLVVSGDFLFFDEWAGFRMLGDGFAYFKEVTGTGALANHWWIGSSIVGAPFYLVSHLISVVLPGDLFPSDGFFGLDLVTLGWTSVLFHALTMLIGWLAIRELTGPTDHDGGGAAISLVYVSVGTPMFWYAFRMPIGTHATGMMLVGLLTLLCIRLASGSDGDEGDSRLPLLTGLTLGLAIATRLQHVVLLPAVLLALTVGKTRRTGWLIAALGGAVPLLAQGAAWFAVYGTPLGPLADGANLDGVTWMPFRRISLLPVLFSPWRGLLVWSPVWLPALIGMVLMLRERGSVALRRAGWICLIMFAGELFANGTLDRYWWGGMSFGPRRFVDLAVPAAIGVWFFLRRTSGPGQVLVLLSATWSCLLMLSATAGAIDLSRYLGWGDLGRGVIEAQPSVILQSLRSPVTSVSLAVQSFLALLILALLILAIHQLRRVTRLSAGRLAFAWATACLLAVLLAIGPTRSRAVNELDRFGLDTPAARAAGPLIDQRGLINDELAWLVASGRTEDAEATRREIEQIDDRLRELGVAR